MTSVSLQSWSLIPGPASDPPASSLDLGDVIHYPPETVARTLLAFPGMRLVHLPEPTWWDWGARWEEGSRWIEVTLTLFESEPPSWGGSDLRGECDLQDILRLWAHLRTSVPSSWMHNADCEIHTPESFGRAVSG